MGRRTYSRQFKQEAVAMAKEGERSVRAVAMSLGIRSQTLQYWIDHPPEASPGSGRRRGAQADASSNDPAALQLRLKEAEARIRQLEMERDILKKATAYFANQSP